MIQPVKVCVKGMAPAPWDGKYQWDWRQKIADKIRQKYGDEPQDLPKQTQFVVEIVFSIMSTKIRQQRSGDIENLSKPVLDTFFKSSNDQSPPALKVSGVLFRNDDINVFELILAKSPVTIEEEQGAEVTITWES
jgi:hypothetical protein